MARTHEDIQDELLLLQCQEGDESALRALIGRWEPRLARHAWRMTGERDAVGDIVQESWLAIVRGMKRLEDPARFRAWAYRIVTNKCADWMRRRTAQRRMTRDLRESAAAVSDQAPGDLSLAADVEPLRQAMSELSPDRRAILSLRYLDGMSVEEIARALSVPVGTVKSRLYHARSHLKQAMERMKT